MANTIWKEVFLIMCSSSWENARNTERFPKYLRITDDYALHTLCCSPHKICNEEGKLNGLELNRALKDDRGRITDIIAGTFLVVGAGEENFDSLTPEQMQKYKKQFRYPETFMRFGNELVAIPIKPRPENKKHRSEPER